WVLFLLVQASMTLFLFQMLISFDISIFWSSIIFGFLVCVIGSLLLFQTKPMSLHDLESAGVLLLIFGVLGAVLPGFLASWEKAQRLMLVKKLEAFQLEPELGFLGLGCFVVLLFGVLFQFRKDKR
ncbi:MAG: hypothetical protein ACE5KK_00740, partial [Candidatus Brocadiales bacterium]